MSIMSQELIRAVMVQTGLPETQAQQAVAAVLAFYEARLPIAATQQLRHLAEGSPPGPPARYNSPGFGMLAESFDHLRRR